MDELSVVLEAREFVNKAAVTGFPVSVKAYADQIGAIIHIDNQLAPDELGCSTLIKGKHHIGVNGNDDETRRRFTVCHEIAHIVLGLPSEHQSLPSWSYAKRSPNEILCDVFASELLLPYDFVASTMAAGSRFAALAGAPCAFVLSEQGKVRYASRSKALREANAWVQPRQPLPKGSVCERLRAGGTCDGPEEIDADIWFSNWERGGALLEDARHLARLDQTIALIWFADEEVPEPSRDRREREQEEFGLAELDGVLPWPGKKRRK